MSDNNPFFDLQVNGYAGVDFNGDALTAEQLSIACERLRDDGVIGILATIISDQLDVMTARLSRIAKIRADDKVVQGVIQGIHIEGPFINSGSGFAGAHPVAAIRPAAVDAMQGLLDAADGLCRLVTLAPECDANLKVTSLLVKRGIRVSAGHCDPSLDQLRAAVDAGLSLFTHLGNGCPMTLDRHDNIVQRALSMHDRLWCCFIADGVHVPFFALGNYLRATGIDRSIVVTDAIAAAGLGPGRYSLGGQDIEVDEHQAARFPDDDSHLAGSAVTMQRAAQNLRDQFGLADTDVRALTYDNPRQALGAV